MSITTYRCPVCAKDYYSLVNYADHWSSHKTLLQLRQSAIATTPAVFKFA